MTWHEERQIVIHNGKVRKVAPDHHHSAISSSTISNPIEAPVQKVTVVPHIKNKGYPTNNPNYYEAHKKASGAEISKFGIDNYLKLEKVVSKTPNDELLGTHDTKGNIYISSIVPKKFIPEVIKHEQTEHAIMSLKSWLDDSSRKLKLISNLTQAKKFKAHYRSEWQSIYNEIFEELPLTAQEGLSSRILEMPKKINEKIREFEE